MNIPNTPNTSSPGDPNTSTPADPSPQLCGPTGRAYTWDLIPHALRDKPAWSLWRKTEDGTRPPIDPRTGKPGNCRLPYTWAPLPVALEAYTNYAADGLQFASWKADREEKSAYSGDDFVVVDLDDCTGPERTPASWAQDIVALLGTYTETSPSEQGLRLFVRGRLPKAQATYKDAQAGISIELWEHTHFAAVTGWHVAGTPVAITPRQDQLDQLLDQYALRGERSTPSGTHHSQVMGASILQALPAIPADEYHTWLRVGMALHSYGPRQEDLDLWDSWSQGSDKYRRGACAKKWIGFRHDGEHGVRLGSIPHLAREHGWQGLRLHGPLPVTPRVVTTPQGLSVTEETYERSQREAATLLLHPSPPYRADDLKEFIALDIKPHEYVLEPIISTQGLVMLHAQRGIGKTFVSLAIAYAVASGGHFLRWRAEKPRRVLFVDGEMSAITVQERLQKLIVSNAPHLPSHGSFKIITPDRQESGIRNLTTPEGQAKIEEHLDGVELLVLDNLSTLASYGEENAAESWQPIQEWALKLRRQGLSVLFVHHSGKSGLQRGTSRREDILNTVFTLKHPSDYQQEQGARFEVHFEKNRGLTGEQVRPFEVMMVEDEEGVQTWTVKSLANAERERVVTLQNEGLTQREIAAALGLSKSKVNRFLIHAQMGGEI